MTPRLDLQFEGDFVGSAGVRVLAAGGCSEKFKHSFPEEPFPVGTWCFGALCVAMTMQGTMEAGVEGSLEVDARAEFFANYRITGSVSLDLQQWVKTGSPPEPSIQLIKISEQWKVNYKGSIEASVSAKIGPVINFVLIPGVFATFTPYITGVASLSAPPGQLQFEKSSGDVDKIPTVEWSDGIRCLANGPPDTDFATVPSGGGFNLANNSFQEG